MNNRIPRILTYLIILLTSIPVFARDFEYTYEGQTLTYTVISEEEGTCQTKDGDVAPMIPGNYVSGELIIPNTVFDGKNEYSVTSIGNYAFCYCRNLTSVTIPNSVTSIGHYAFVYCSSLTSVIIPNSVTSIGHYAFYECSSLISVAIPNSVTSIGIRAFNGCYKLIKSAYPNTIFDPFPSGVTIGYNPNGAIIEDGWIYGSGKSEIIFAPSTFSGDYRIPETVYSIGNYAFYECNGLTSVIIPNSVTKIGDNAFAGCISLTSVTIPGSVTSIGHDAFSGCSGLDKTEYGSIESLCSIDFGNENSNPLRFTNNLFINGEEIKDIVIPNSVSTIGNYAFEGYSGLTSVTIPNSVTSIGNYAFSGCSGLTSVTIPESVTAIGIYAFSGCRGLTSVTIPESVTKIGNSAFSGCSGLTSVTIPASVTTIGDDAFSGCSRLTELYFNAENCLKCGSLPNSIKKVVIGENVKAIPDYAFSGCRSLTSVTIPESVTIIGGSAFEDCSGLTSVTIGNSVQSIGKDAFKGCRDLTKAEFGCIIQLCGINFGNEYSNPLYYVNNLYINGEEITNLVIPFNVTSIGNYSFYNCSGLTSVTIPESVTTIGQRAFSGCSGLTTIYSYNTTPPATGNGTFDGVPYDAIVYVPKGRALAYSNHNGWKAFYDFREMGALTITLNKDLLSMNTNETETLVSTIGNPENVGIKSEKWTSTNPEVATVENGLVTAVSVGTTTINFTVTDEFDIAYNAYCTVTVTDRSAVDSVFIDKVADVEIFTLNGTKVNSSINHLVPGIYILRKGNETTKIVVK
ncbi:MAG: leucine-rich repeat protein [Muribaculaceae bacterium]|nr:leucine-rich repeat protein [Muribaculaceae bacterium]